MPILEFSSNTPLADGRQSERALAVRRGVVRLFGDSGMAVIAELPLANGRRADLIAMDRKGRFTIVEVKSSIEDFKADNKWPEYAGFCDAFYFATLPDVPAAIFPQSEGFIIADQYGAEILREANPSILAGPTRKALTLRFARAAAARLERVLDHVAAHEGLVLPGGLEAIDGT